MLISVGNSNSNSTSSYTLVPIISLSRLTSFLAVLLTATLFYFPKCVPNACRYKLRERISGHRRNRRLFPVAAGQLSFDEGTQRCNYDNGDRSRST